MTPIRVRRRPGRATSDTDRIAAAVEAVAASGRPCLLCGGVPDGVACFVPTDPEYRAAVGAQTGKGRALFYATYSTCAAELAREPERFEPLIVAAFTRDRAAVN